MDQRNWMIEAQREQNDGLRQSQDILPILIQEMRSSFQTQPRAALSSLPLVTASYFAQEENRNRQTGKARPSIVPNYVASAFMVIREQLTREDQENVDEFVRESRDHGIDLTPIPDSDYGKLTLTNFQQTKLHPTTQQVFGNALADGLTGVLKQPSRIHLLNLDRRSRNTRLNPNQLSNRQLFEGAVVTSFTPLDRKNQVEILEILGKDRNR